ncbi:hypothetical protein BH09DEP1_BH09DEP1_4640 [soil metagenome]
MELLKKAQENVDAYCSLNQKSINCGFWEARTIATNQYLEKLRLHVAAGILEGKSDLKSQPMLLEGEKFPDEKDFPSYEQVKAMVLESHTDIASKVWHWMVKNYIEQIPYLLDKKSQITAMAILHLHPAHPHHTENWKLNLNDKFHQFLIYQGIDREYKLSYTIEEAIEAGDLSTLTKLDPNNPQNAHVMSLLASFYPPVLQAVITGAIHKAKCDKEKDEAQRAANLRDQQEFIEKSNQVTPLILALRKKIADSNNKEKLKSLTEAQKNIPIIAGNLLTAHHGAGLVEMRKAYQMLTEFSTLVEKLLASPTPVQTQNPPALELTNSATNNPSQAIKLPALAPLVGITPIAPSALSTASALPQQNQLQEPTAPPAPKNVVVNAPAIPLTPLAIAASNETLTASPQSVSPSSSISQAANPEPPKSTSKETSPQASPPHTPEGSLVVAAQDLKKSDSEDFNPRIALPPPTNAAQTKLAAAMTPPSTIPATAKQQSVSKNGKKNK